MLQGTEARTLNPQPHQTLPDGVHVVNESECSKHRRGSLMPSSRHHFA
jgi:hypothetical protein